MQLHNNHSNTSHYTEDDSCTLAGRAFDGNRYSERQPMRRGMRSCNKKDSRVFHAAVGLWCVWGLLTACVASPEDLSGIGQPGEATLLQPATTLAGGVQSYTARSQGHDDLLAHRTGFALDANVIGAGPDARVYIVDKTADDGTAGTLRDALESTEKYWIRFAPALAGQSITVKSSISVKSHKTIDGRMNYAQPVRIKTNATSTHSVLALVFSNQTQLIVMNINFDDGYDGWKNDSERSEAIHIFNSTHIWLHQNRFARFRDTVVETDIKENPSDTNIKLSNWITMSYNLFERQYQAVVLGAMNADFHHNRCLNSGARCPKVIGPDGGGTNVYIYNNLIEFWQRPTIHDLGVRGNYLAVRNVYNPRTEALRANGDCGGSSDDWDLAGNLKVGDSPENVSCLEIREPHVEGNVANVAFFPSSMSPPPPSCTASPPIPASVNLQTASDALAASLRNNARPQAFVVDNRCH